MLRKTLLATTALVLCASLAYAGQKRVVPHESSVVAKAFRGLTVGHVVNGIPVTVITSKRDAFPAHNVAPNLESAIFSNYSKNANAQFISWYGFAMAKASSCSSYSGYHQCFTLAENNAFAFTPAANVTTRKVTVPLFSFAPSSQFEVDIYSSVGGLPGKVIAHSKRFTASDTSICCASRTVAIKANLIAGTQYFLGAVCASTPCRGGWNMEDTDLSGAAVDYVYFQERFTYSSGNGTYSSSLSSPWHASYYLPETGAAMLK